MKKTPKINRYKFYDKSIAELENHARVANEEMSTIKEDIAEIKVHVKWVKETYENWEKRWNKLDDRVWYILTSVILGFLGSLVMFGLTIYFK